MTCTCSTIQIGTKTSDLKNLNPECPEHGFESVWYNSSEQIKHREERSKRLKELHNIRKKTNGKT